MPSRFCFLFVAAALVAASVQAGTPQSLTAQVGDIAFESGDEEIHFVPIGDTFSLSASTRGAAAWPPPKTRIDRLAITCDGFVEGRPLVRDHRDFERSTCSVTFERGTQPMGGAAEAEFTLDKDAADNRFEIEAAAGKVYKGRFAFRLKAADGSTVSVTAGRFTVEDRQL
ncbi:MAG: hypothetical protein J0L88_13770 [Xanthomonadales bacterium]|nr:hypothetical protein [Xanthomonadales bacterium]